MGYQLSRSDGKAWNRDIYEWKSASVNVAGTNATTDITSQAGFTTLFDTLSQAHHIVIQASATAYIRLNSATADKITVDATNPITADYLLVEKIFVSTGGGAVTITIFLS